MFIDVETNFVIVSLAVKPAIETAMKAAPRMLWGCCKEGNPGSGVPRI
jgi:hypothetical protein